MLDPLSGKIDSAKTAPPATSIETSDARFIEDVVKGSDKAPVIAYFTAPWCGPCKTLGPALEAAVAKAKGALTLAKINIDKNPAIAAQMRVQSIPTVYAFFKGQPVDGFQGALPPSQITAFLDRVVAVAGGDTSGGLDEALHHAETLLEQGAAAEAAQIYATILAEDNANATALAGLAQAHIALGDLTQAEAVLNAAPAAIAAAAPLAAARARITLAQQAQDAGPLRELQRVVQARPDDHQARFELAQALYANGDAEAAVAALLELFRRDRHWNDGAAKAQLLTIFESLKPADPVVLSGRRRLSSMIFS